MNFSLQRWLRIALLNLLIVAAIGVILRYKIIYPLPFVDQKHLLHGHSHFAFAGWVTQVLMIFLIAYLDKQNDGSSFKKYRWLLYANLFTAYAMLIAFPIEGYGLYSIIFSTLSIFVSYVFAVQYWRDLNKLKLIKTSHYWFKAAIIFNALSSLGAFALAIMMVKKMIILNWYLAAEYFYLHFQYNGWFFFGCMGLVSAKFFDDKISPKTLNRIFLFFVLALVPAYFLSALWMHLPLWIYILVVIAAFAQVAGWVYMLQIIRQQLSFIKQGLGKTAKWLLLFSSIALSAKLLLQLGSTIPSLSTLAFGFRPIVIGYLHLVLLGVITMFLLGYMFAAGYCQSNKIIFRAAEIFAAGIILNEVLLMLQGVMAIDYTIVPYINDGLLGAALIMFSGILVLVANLQKKLQ